MRILFSFLLFILSLQLQAQEKKTDSIITEFSQLSDLIVYVNKFPEHIKRVAQTVSVLSDKTILNNQTNTADALINSGFVFVQKSQQGGGSPVIRGFEASRVLLMIDGVRMNNAIFRSGHLQNIITVDNSILDRIEVIYGPSSTIYGSDALGGVVNMFTKNPILLSTEKLKLSVNSLMRFSTATEEIKSHVDFNIGGKKWAFFTSITAAKFGDVLQGNNRLDAYPNFGKKFFIVDRINNRDTALVNTNPNKQIGSAFNQIDFVQKILFQPNNNAQHLINFQLSNSSDIPRYDRLSESVNNIPTFAEWYYGPQFRNLISYEFKKSKMNGFIKEISVVSNFQNIEESRITRRFRNNNKDSRIEKVNVYGLNIDAKHYNKKNEFHFGVEAYQNNVNSKAKRENISNGFLSKIQTRYSDGPTNMSYLGAYTQHTFKLNEFLTLNDGLRINLVKLNANFIDTAIMHLPFTNANQNNFAVTGNLGLVFYKPNKLRVSFNLSSGFRSPNVDDLTKVFDTRTGYVVVPNPSIKPEYTYNAELNFNQTINNFNYGASVFYTRFSNAIVVDKYLLNGQSAIMYQNVLSDVYAPQNKAKANVYGFSINAALKLNAFLKADATYTYTKGKYFNNNIQVPLDHIPPAFGRISLSHQKERYFVTISSLFNGWKKISDYNLNGEDNEQYATLEGMPSWMILNVQTGVELNKNVNLNLSVENIFDKNYRYFASGISAAGRNFCVTLKTQF